MNVLITGATGLLGAALCQRLSNTHLIGVLSRRPDVAKERLPTATEAWAWQPRDSPPPRPALVWADAIIHLAGESVQGRWTKKKKQAIRASRSEGTRHLVDGIAALEAAERPELLISASAIGYYGDRGDDELSEEEEAGTDYLAEVCASWEKEAVRAETLGVRVIRTRLGIVLSSEGGALKEMLGPTRLGLNGPMGSGKQWWSWIHIDDVVALLETALESDWSGAVNVTAPEPLRQKMFAKALGKAMRRPSFLPVPAVVLRMALGGFSAELLSSRRVMPTRAMQAGFVFRFPTLEEALEDLLK